MNRLWMILGGLIGLAALGLLTPPAALAATKTWTGGGGDANWTTGANWGGTAPSADDDLVFPAGAARLTNTNDFPAGTSFNTIAIDGSGYAIGGNSIRLTSSLASDVASPGVDQLNVDVNLPFIEPFTVANSGAQLNMGGALSGNGSLQKLGAGTLLLRGSSANTYSSTTSAIAGTLELDETGGGNAIPGTLAIGTDLSAGTVRLLAGGQIADTAQVQVFSGGVFDLNGFSDTIGALQLRTNDTTAAQVTTGPGTLTLSCNVTLTAVNTGATGATVSGHLGLGSATRTFTIANGTAAPDLDVSAAVSGTGGLTKTGAGTLQFSGLPSNTYTGTTTVADGTLQLNKSGGSVNSYAIAGLLVIGDGVGVANSAVAQWLAPFNLVDTLAVTVNGDGLLDLTGWAESPGSLAGSGNVGIGNAVLSVGGDNTSTTFSGVISGGGSQFAKAGTGTLTLSGTNAFTGTTAVQGGTLLVTNASALGGSASGQGTTVSSGATLAVSGGITVAEPLTLNGNGVGGHGALITADVSEPAWTGPITLATDSSVNSGSAFTVISGPIGGAGGLTKVGGGLLLVQGSNTYAGATTVSAGELDIFKSSGLGGTAAGTTVQSGARLTLAGNGMTVAESLTISGTGGFGNALENDGSNNTWSGPITLAADTSILCAFSDPFTISGVISGSGGINKFGPATLRFAGNASNTYTGTTTVNVGTLELGKTSGINAIVGPLVAGPATSPSSGGTVRLLASNQIADTVPVTINSAGVLDMGSLVDAIGSLSGSGQVILGAGLLELGHDNSSTVYSGLISGAGGRLDKRGTGTLTLTGNNTYTGQTFLAAGTLLVNGAQPSSPITLAGGTLSGTGTVGPITAQTGGTVSPGASPGILNTGSLAFNAATIFVAELNGTTPGTGYDQLNVTGTVTLGGTLSATIGFAASPGTSFVIVQNDGNDPVQGGFSGLSEGSFFTIGGQDFQISYKGGDGNDVALLRVAPCTVRPNVRLPVQPSGDGRLQVTVFAGADPVTHGLVQQLQFTRLTNAVIEDANHVALPNPVLLNPPQTSFQFFVRRAAAGQASTAELMVTDTCGQWPTFVGGGAGAF
ncbi:MAG TPA: autotransporter-associated beta strand repeat-containing protein [Chloroflexota bacterium]